MSPVDDEARTVVGATPGFRGQERAENLNCATSAAGCKELSLADLKHRIVQEHEAVVGALGVAVEHAVRAGLLLRDLKAKLPHGDFGAAFAEMPFAETTGRGYMRLAGFVEQNGNAVAGMSLRQALAHIAEPREPASAPAQPKSAADYFAGHPFETDPTVKMFGWAEYPGGPVGSAVFIIEPSSQPGYFFVSRLAMLRDGGGSTLENTKRPIAAVAVGWVLHAMDLLGKGQIAAGAVRWDRFPCDPATRPFFDEGTTAAERFGGAA